MSKGSLFKKRVKIYVVIGLPFILEIIKSLYDHISLAIENIVFSVRVSVRARPRGSEFTHLPLLATWMNLPSPYGFITWNVSNTWKHHPKSLIHRHPTRGRKLIAESFGLLCWVTARSSCLDFNLEELNFHHKNTMHLVRGKQEQEGKTSFQWALHFTFMC